MFLIVMGPILIYFLHSFAEINYFLMATGESNEDESYRDNSADNLSESSDNLARNVTEHDSPTAAVVPCLLP